jgi:hypothetical protein
MILIGIFEKEAFNDYEVKMEKAKAAEKKLADLWTESVEAAADLKRLDDQIKQAKVEIGVAIVAGKAADNSKLTSLLEKRAEIELRLADLGMQINDAKAELKGAKG